MTVEEFIQGNPHRYKTNPDFILRRISGEAVIVPVGESAFGNSMISVNETFAFLWELFSEPRTLAEAVRLTREEFEAPEGELESHVVSFVGDALKYGMISKEE